MFDLLPRLDGLLRGGERRSHWLLPTLIAALPCINLITFVWGTANTAIIEDQWHFLPMISDYLTGQFHAFSLWATHTQHRTPGYKLLFLADAVFFKLDLRLEIMAGLAILIVSVLLLIKRFQDSLPAGTTPTTMLLGSAAIVLIGFNLNQWGNLAYSLTALAGYIGILCFVWVWLMLDTQLRRGTSAWKTAGLCLTLAFTLMMFAAGMGPALIATLLLVPVVIMALERRIGKDNLVLLGWLLLCSVVCELIYWKTPGVKIGSPHSQPFMAVFLQSPGSVLEYTVLAFASSVIPADAIERHFHELGHMFVMLAGTTTICLYAFSGFTYLRLRMWKASYLPAFLMTFSAFFILSTLIVRLPSAGVGNAETPRYVLYSQLGSIGCLWILFHWFASRIDRRPTLLNRFFNPAAGFAATLMLYTLGLVALWGSYSYAVHNKQMAIQEVLSWTFHPSRLDLPRPAAMQRGPSNTRPVSAERVRWSAPSGYQREHPSMSGANI